MQEVEKDVILRWREGDKSAFETLVRRHMTDAYLIALGFTGNPDDARDLSQDAFIKAHKARKKFDPERPFYPWFYRLLKNHCLNFLQRRRKRHESLYYEDSPDQERFASDSPTPLEQVERKERVRLMRAAVDRLSDEHREVIILKNFKGYAYKEIAQVLEVPIGTVMSRLYYARKALKEIVLELEQKGLENSIADFPEGDPTRGEVI